MKVEVKWTSTTCLDTEMICKMPGCLHIMNGNHPSSVQNLEMAQFSGYRGGSQVMLKLESHGPQMIAKELMVLHLQKWCQQTCYTLDVEPLGNTGMNCISTGSADCHTQGCRIASQVWRSWHLYLEDVAEMDHTTRELCQCWISTGFGLGRQLSSPAHPGKTDTELFRLQGLSQFHCFAPIIVIQKYARQKSCCDFAVPNNSFDFNIHIFVWRRIRFLQILSEAASGHTHTHTETKLLILPCSFGLSPFEVWSSSITSSHYDVSTPHPGVVWWLPSTAHAAWRRGRWRVLIPRTKPSEAVF